MSFLNNKIRLGLLPVTIKSCHSNMAHNGTMSKNQIHFKSTATQYVLLFFPPSISSPMSAQEKGNINAFPFHFKIAFLETLHLQIGIKSHNPFPQFIMGINIHE